MGRISVMEEEAVQDEETRAFGSGKEGLEDGLRDGWIMDVSYER